MNMNFKRILFCICTSTIVLFSGYAAPKKEAAQTNKKHAGSLPKTGIHYEAVIDYPLFSEHPQLNTLVADTVSKACLTYLRDMFQTSIDFTAEAPSQFNFETCITPYEIYEDSQYISFLLSHYVYTGGAHGSTVLLPITYSKAEKKLLTLKDVFNPLPENWLEQLSAEARRQLAEQVKQNILTDNAEWIKSGTEPEEALFSVFKLEKDTVRIIFGQYQVAPYAVGMPEITIPRNFFQK